ncbi:hypothetical protein CXX84_10240 [Arthrobacter sp. AFG7.2]|uniref:hypothetical protein n=1 Tax=Arthrobacter sp. AFG7.2 TaxID=1688693 RepID=UPI000C9DBCF8|nr:hypothetical protein [Arthrobacter sp. AFG7.2]PNI08988.1 hypothetical protein CXX84_10240 [Arthrobacter sp. AFG7.2]
MRSSRSVFLLSVTVSAALAVTGCMSNTPAGNGGTTTPTALPPASASEPAVAGPPASIIPAATSSPVPKGPVTFTFADGRLSFAHPEGWHVEHEQVSMSPAVETATIYDAGGNEQINIYYSQVGDATAGPATRFVLETDPVPGLIGHSVPTPSSSFFVDHADGAAHYRMGLTAGAPVSPDGKVQYGPIRIGDRILTADVLFTGEPFADDVAAKAWYWGDEGRTLKAVLMSFSYR